MYQMKCPDLEHLRMMEDWDGPDGAGTRTEVDEARGKLRAQPCGMLKRRKGRKFSPAAF